MHLEVVHLPDRLVITRPTSTNRHEIRFTSKLDFTNSAPADGQTGFMKVTGRALRFSRRVNRFAWAKLREKKKLRPLSKRRHLLLWFTSPFQAWQVAPRSPELTIRCHGYRRGPMDCSIRWQSLHSQHLCHYDNDLNNSESWIIDLWWTLFEFVAVAQTRRLEIWDIKLRRLR